MKGKGTKKTSSPLDLIVFSVLITFLILFWIVGRLLFQQPKKIDLPKAGPVQVLKPFGKIAIIIDDSGYNLRDCYYLKTIQSPVNIAILPHIPYSEEIAECAHRYNKLIMLHLPLEPYSTTQAYPQNYIISTQMPKEKIIHLFNQAATNFPNIQGINNHMGSKATENVPFMTVLFDQLQKKGLFMVDSRVTKKSICRSLARRMKLPFAERDVFLDNINERAYIEGQFQKLVKIAQRQGRAIGIGHARDLTWRIIKEQIPFWEKKGIQFVTVKDLLKTH